MIDVEAKVISLENVDPVVRAVNLGKAKDWIKEAANKTADWTVQAYNKTAEFVEGLPDVDVNFDLDFSIDVYDIDQTVVV